MIRLWRGRARARRQYSEGDAAVESADIQKAQVTGIERAKKERAASQKRLDDSIPLIDALKEMHRRNHVGDILDELVYRRTGDGS